MGEEQQAIDNIDTLNARMKPLSPEQRKRKQQRFLKVYRDTANVKASCKAAGISRQTFYNWRDNDEEFSAELPDAEEDANDTLEYAAYDRAVLGVETYVVSQGRIVYEEIPVFDAFGEQVLDDKGNPVTKRGKPLIERKYSDSLLITRLKARMPEKYREKQQVDLNANVNAQVQASHEIAISPRDLTDEELSTMKALAKNAMERKKQKGEQ